MFHHHNSWICAKCGKGIQGSQGDIGVSSKQMNNSLKWEAIYTYFHIECFVLIAGKDFMNDFDILGKEEIDLDVPF